jgi:hypothetical protein
VGVFSNRLLLGAIGIALGFAGTVVYVPAFQSVFGTAALAPHQLAILLPFPFIVWGADEARRWWLRRKTTVPAAVPSQVPPTPARTNRLGSACGTGDENASGESTTSPPLSTPESTREKESQCTST